MRYFRGFGVFFKDPEWGSKLLVGSLVVLSAMIIPVVGQVALLGWAALVTRRAIQDHGEGPLPRLDFDFGWLGKLVGIGFKPFLVNFLWRLPAMFLTFGLVFCMYFSMIAAAISGAESARHGGSHAGGAAAGGVMVFIGIAFIVLIPILIALQIPAQAAMLRVEATDDLNAGMKFKEVLAMTKLVFKELLIGNFLIALVSIPLALVGMLLCYVGIFPVVVLLVVVQAHFMAQVYERYLEKGGEPLTIPPDPELVAPPAPPPASPPPATAASGW